MKNNKLIVFAKQEDFSTIFGIDFSYSEGGIIGVKENTAVQIKTFDNSYDIYLFEDKKPSKSSLFFEIYIPNFYKEKDMNSYYIVFHESAGWSFNSFYKADGNLNSDYREYAKEIDWINTIPSIIQSHISVDIYKKELLNIAKAILKKKPDVYKNQLHKLILRFNNPFSNIFENLLSDLLNKKHIISDDDRYKNLFQKYPQVQDAVKNNCSYTELRQIGKKFKII